MSTQNIDIKDIAKLPSIKSWKSDELARRMAFRLFSNLKHGELIVREGDETHRFGGHDLSVAPSVTVTINDPALTRDRNGWHHWWWRSLH